MKVLDYQIHTPLNEAVISHSQEVLIFSFRETTKGTSHGKYFLYFTLSLIRKNLTENAQSASLISSSMYQHKCYFSSANLPYNF